MKLDLLRVCYTCFMESWIFFWLVSWTADWAVWSEPWAISSCYVVLATQVCKWVLVNLILGATGGSITWCTPQAVRDAACKHGPGGPLGLTADCAFLLAINSCVMLHAVFSQYISTKKPLTASQLERCLSFVQGFLKLRIFWFTVYHYSVTDYCALCPSQCF